MLRFDAGTLGNHEFNYGLDFLQAVLAGADFPLVCANIANGRLAATARRDEPMPSVKPCILVERKLIDGDSQSHDIRVGLIGFVPPQVMSWDRRWLEGNVAARDIVSAASNWVPEMREAGADIVMAWLHSDIDVDTSDGMENAALQLAGVTGIDVLLLGHRHLVFPGPGYDGPAGVDASAGTLQGKPAVMGGFWGSHLGLIDLLLEQDGRGWRVVSYATEARPIFERVERDRLPLVDGDPAVLASVQAEHDATLACVRRPVGNTDAPLHS